MITTGGRLAGSGPGDRCGGSRMYVLDVAENDAAQRESSSPRVSWAATGDAFAGIATEVEAMKAHLVLLDVTVPVTTVSAPGCVVSRYPGTLASSRGVPQVSWRVSTLPQPSRPIAERLAQRASDWHFPGGLASGRIGECVSGWHGLGAGARGERGERAMTVPTTNSAMYQTIHRQPAELRRLLSDGWEQAAEAAERLQGARRVYTVGIGTSYHAALVCAWLLRAAGCDARAVNSFDFAVYPQAVDLGPEDAVVVLAHTGVKRYSSEALARARAAGAITLSVGSLTAEHPGSQLVLRTVDRERSAAYTASHTAAMTVLAQVATELGERRQASAVAGFRQALMSLPDQVADMLAREDEVWPVARLAAERRVYVSGAGPNEATALEAVIKVREAAYGQIDALALEQFLHGPIVALNAGDQAILVHVPGRATERVREIAAVLGAIGAELWVVGQPIDGLGRAIVFELPEIPELLSPLLAVAPIQLLAHQMAVLKGVNPDTFRRDDPRYAAAFGLLKL